MKKVVIAVFFVSSMITAQDMKVLSWDFKNLKGVTEYNLTFDYSNLKVDEFETEEAFLNDKMKKREENGTDDDFKKSWFADRENRYEPKFIESFNKRFNNGEIKASKDLKTAKYTIKAKTTWIYPGYNVGVWRQNAKINAVITIFETVNPSNVLASIEYKNVPGNGAMGYDYNSGYRISEAYAKLAKEFAANVYKKAMK